MTEGIKEVTTMTMMTVMTMMMMKMLRINFGSSLSNFSLLHHGTEAAKPAIVAEKIFAVEVRRHFGYTGRDLLVGWRIGGMFRAGKIQNEKCNMLIGSSQKFGHGQTSKNFL